jgi:hypothetical protein
MDFTGPNNSVGISPPLGATFLKAPLQLTAVPSMRYQYSDRHGMRHTAHRAECGVATENKKVLKTPAMPLLSEPPLFGQFKPFSVVEDKHKKHMASPLKLDAFTDFNHPDRTAFRDVNMDFAEFDLTDHFDKAFFLFAQCI